MPNYYQILGLHRGCSKEDVKLAFRKLAMIHHPDRGGNVKMFIRIKEAYEIVSKEVEGGGQYSAEGTYYTPSYYSQTASNAEDINDILRRNRQTMEEMSRVFEDALNQMHRGWWTDSTSA